MKVKVEVHYSVTVGIDLDDYREEDDEPGDDEAALDRFKDYVNTDTFEFLDRHNADADVEVISEK